MIQQAIVAGNTFMLSIAPESAICLAPDDRLIVEPADPDLTLAYLGDTHDGRTVAVHNDLWTWLDA